MKYLGNKLIIDQRIYLKQIYTRLLNRVDNHCWQYYNELILLQWFLNDEHICNFTFSYLTFSAFK